MANSIAQASAYLNNAENLNAVFMKASVTADLETKGIEFLNANTAYLPKYAFSVSAPSAIDTTAGTLTVADLTYTYQAYTLTQWIGNTLKLSKANELGSGANVVSAVNRYIREIVVPAVDKYRLGKCVTGGTTTVLATTVANAYTALVNMDDALLDYDVDTAGGILYVCSAFNAKLRKSSEVQKNIFMGQFGGDVKNQYELYNDAKIVRVPANRWPNVKASFIFVKPEAVLCVTNHESAVFYDKVPGFVGSQVDYNMYHDFWVITNKAHGVYVNLESAL